MEENEREMRERVKEKRVEERKGVEGRKKGEIIEW